MAIMLPNKGLENCTDLIIGLSQEGKVFLFNKAAENIFGLKRTQIFGNDFFISCQKFNIQLDFNLSDLKRYATQNHQSVETTITGLNGAYGIVLEFFSETNQSNEINYFILGRDKTKYKEANTYLQRVIENLPQYVYWKDSKFVYQGCNRLVANYLHLKSPNEIVGKTDSDFDWTEERINFLRQMDQEVIEKNHSVTVEDAIPYDGSIRTMLTTKTALSDAAGTIIGILGISVDITERKELEKELKISKESSEKALITARQAQIEEEKHRKEAEKLHIERSGRKFQTIFMRN